MTSPSAPGLVWVVVVHHGDPGPTLHCLQALADDPSAARRTVVVVDNSGDFPRQRLPPEVAYRACPDNPGYGAGVHHGLDELARRAQLAEDPENAAPAVYLVLNHDLRILPGYLDAALAVIHTEGACAQPGRPAVGAAAGPIYLDQTPLEQTAPDDTAPDGTALDHAASSPAASGDSAPGRLWYAGGHLRRLTGTVYQSRSPDDARRARDVGFLPGAALVLRPEAWHAVGGFDPSFFLYHEDVDLCQRLARAGWRLRFEPQLRAVHSLGRATGSAEASPFYLEHLTATRLRPYPSRLYRAYLALLHSGWVALRVLRFLLPGRAAGRRRARALLRGHRRALGDVLRPYRPGASAPLRSDSSRRPLAPRSPDEAPSDSESP
ncbi:MAG: glycosyltransferase family 2 protein [Acidobacteriota bacterium]|nr:glycosyltransferase family 2 protein [Acidobacteriota bacterium]